MHGAIDVNTGDVIVSRTSNLRTVALGSCIALTAYDLQTRNAGIAHIMLPGRSSSSSIHKTRYAADAIEYLFSLLYQDGAENKTIDICLVGAGNVLRKTDDTICESNISSVTSILAEKGISVRASVLGGFDRKSVYLERQTGIVTYTIGDSHRQTLWTSSTPTHSNSRQKR